ncbi:MAG: C4-dicarboxylate ABC transporter substrate-binding protein, partial [Betaproteobacteria bacterium]|nr:C4-dicarboxylate ABC transporter substrate-binding protein [Betaproteobacteria bacterium]
MQGLLKFSNGIDRFNTWINRYVIWLILGSTAISALNAVVRKVFNYSSNAFLE